MKKLIQSTLWMAAGVMAVILTTTSAFAEAGRPVNWGLGLQDPVTPIAVQINDFHTLLLWITGLITLFVTFLLLYVMCRFREGKNPEPALWTHNTKIEIAWTVIPILILVFIAVPSFKLLYNQYDFTEKADVTIKAIGQKWYWDYVYPDYDELELTAAIMPDDELEDKSLRLLKTDTPILVPVNKIIDMLITSDPTGVIHAWTVPSFGVKVDAVPGRIVRTRFKATKTGTYYGQCSELCGKDHAYMPIEVKVVEQAEFDAWIKKQVEEASNGVLDPKVKFAKTKQKKLGQPVKTIATVKQ